MKTNPKRPNRAILTFSLSLLILEAGSSSAEAGAVKDMMRGLEMSLALIETGIVESDLKKVVTGADWIAKRDEPGLFEKAKTLAELGSDAPRFRKADGTMRKAARATGVAATRHDLDAVRVNTQLIRAECHTCHQRQTPPVNPGEIGKDGSAKLLKKEKTDE